MQKVYYKRIITCCDLPKHNEIFDSYITYGLNRINRVEICRTPPLADMKEWERLEAKAMNVPANQVKLVKK